MWQKLWNREISKRFCDTPSLGYGFGVPPDKREPLAWSPGSAPAVPVVAVGTLIRLRIETLIPIGTYLELDSHEKFETREYLLSSIEIRSIKGS